MALIGAVVSTLVLERLLSVAALGDYFVLASLVGPLAIAGVMGLDVVATDEVARRHGHSSSEETAKALARAGLRTGALAASLAVLVSVVAPISTATAAIILAPLALWVFAESARLVSSSTLRAMDRARRASLSGEVTRTVVSILALVLFVPRFSTEQPVGALWAMAGATLIAATVAVEPLLREGPRAERLPRQWSRRGRRVALTSALTWLANRSDILLVGLVMGSASAATYGIAIRAAMLLSLPLLIANVVVAPRVSAPRPSGSSHEIETVLRRTAALASTVTLVASAVVLFRGPALLRFALSGDHESAALVASILGLGLAANAATGLCGTVLMVTGHEKQMIRIVTVSAVSAAVTIATVASSSRNLAATAAAVAIVSTLQNLWTAYSAWTLTGIRTWWGWPTPHGN